MTRHFVWAHKLLQVELIAVTSARSMKMVIPPFDPWQQRRCLVTIPENVRTRIYIEDQGFYLWASAEAR